MATFPPGFKHLRKSAVGHRWTRSVQSPNNTHDNLRIMTGFHTKSTLYDVIWTLMGAFVSSVEKSDRHMPGTCPAAQFWSQIAHRRPQNSLAYSRDQPLRSSPRSPAEIVKIYQTIGTWRELQAVHLCWVWRYDSVLEAVEDLFASSRQNVAECFSQLCNEELTIGRYYCNVVKVLWKYSPLLNQGTALEKNSGPNFASQPIDRGFHMIRLVHKTLPGVGLTICEAACPQQPHSPEKCSHLFDREGP